MFKNLFNSSEPKKKPSPGRSAAADPAIEALLRVIAERRGDDPLIGAKLGGKEVVQRLINGFRDDKGVHVETVLSALGALAGYACQASVRAELVLLKGLPEGQVFVTVNGADGKKYFFGDALNEPLARGRHSVWNLTAGAAQHAGATQLPDVSEVFEHVSKTVGGSQFGIPRIPPQHQPADLPANFVKHMWPTMFPVIKQFCAGPAEWPILYGLAIAEVFELGKGVIDPALAVSIVMESAVPMSKVDLGRL